MTREEWKDWAAAIERPRLEAEAKERERAVQEMYWRCLQGAANVAQIGQPLYGLAGCPYCGQHPQGYGLRGIFGSALGWL